MLWKIAWRNLWRNRRRSIIILTSIVVGVIALILTDAIMRGFVRQMLHNQISIDVGHLQIHTRGYRDNPLLEKTIDHPEEVERVLQREKGVVAYSPRILTYGLLTSSYNSTGIRLTGIDPEKERTITSIARSITQGRYLSGKDREIVISEKVAEKLEIELGDKVVSMASRTDGSVGSEVFRVVGLFRTFDSEFDKIVAYVPRQSAERMLGLEGKVHEFAALVEDLQSVEAIRDELRLQLGESFEVFSFRDILPILVYMVDAFDQFMQVYYLIIGIALVFGIINTMLMAVFERIQEIGVLKAIGMPNHRVFAMIVLESTILGLLGTAIGTILGYLCYLPLSHTGLNLSMFAESLTSFGVGAIIYPIFETEMLVSVFFSIPMFAVLGAIWPAIRAIRFRPIEALRYV